ncbi:MAG: bifunctional transaldolase/phosoglucose isomerase [Deltaproteobacteria bacterium]|nr:bifunctional transaldolase/phosoglucose isomerase [Deltaproteobacteria bacterium]
MNPLLELKRLGQSVWHDNMRKGVVATGEIKRLIDEYAVSGVTSNLSLMARAMTGALEYDDDISLLLKEGLNDSEIAVRLLVRDARHAADALLPLWKLSNGADGFAAVDVIGADLSAASLVDAARSLVKAVDRPNVLVRIPATGEGLEAIEVLTFAGIGVYATLICSVRRYEAATVALLRGLERRAAEGMPIDTVPCAAGFTVSRADTVFDRILEERAEHAKGNDEKSRLRALLGRAAVANAKLAFLKHEEARASARFKKLKSSGAKPQLLIWESAGTKNHLYSGMKYAEELSLPGTAISLPLHTLLAFHCHGRPASQTSGLEAAKKVFDELGGLGIEYAEVAADLEEGCLKSLAASREAVAKAVAERRQALSKKTGPTSKFTMGRFDSPVAEALDSVIGEDFFRKLGAHDPSIWKAGLGDKKQIKGSLGWTILPYLMEEHVDEINDFAAEIKAAGFKDAVLLGMGGSSLAPLVFATTFGSAPGCPGLIVLDSTDPGALKSVMERIDLEKTLFIVSSKSGSTIEPLSLFEYFHAALERIKGEESGRNFIAITDPATPLEGFARKYRFRKVFTNPKDVGGRFSALSYFGLLPAAITGVDISRLLEHAGRVDSLLHPCAASSGNPVMMLGAALGSLGLKGRDKLTFFLPKEIETFGMWIEQLVAESTGKEGRGLVPVSGEPVSSVSSYGSDRVFISMTLGDGDRANETVLGELAAAGHPVIELKLRDKYELGGEFLRWEAVTAIAGQILGINPFDQPDVELAKKLAASRLNELGGEGGVKPPGIELKAGGVRLNMGKSAFDKTGYKGADAAEALKGFLKLVGKDDYIGLLAYYDPFDARLEEAFRRVRLSLRDSARVATQFGYGPRYLHSTGQLHKGRPDCGVFIIFCHGALEDFKVPGSSFTFSGLELSQAFGDMEALDSKGSRVVLVMADGPSEECLRPIEDMLKAASRS